MKALWNIVRKDLQSAWLLATLYAALFAFQQILAWGKGGPEWAQPFVPLRGILMTMHGVLAWFVAHRVIAEDNPAKDSPAWLHLPVRGLGVYWAKFTGLQLLLVVPTGILLVAIEYTLGQRDLLHYEQVLWQAVGGIFVSMGFALFALSIARHIALAVVLWALIPFIVFGLALYSMAPSLMDLKNAKHQETRFAISFVFGLSAYIAAGVQYSSRRLFRAVWTVILLTAAGTVAVKHSDWRPVHGAKWGVIID